MRKLNKFSKLIVGNLLPTKFALKLGLVLKVAVLSSAALASDPGGFGGGDGGSGGSVHPEEVKDYGYNFFEQNNITPDIPTLTTDLFGDQIDPASGSINFEQTDVLIPGNSELTVAITRTLSDPDSWFRETREFENWSLQIPHVRSSYITDKSGNPKTAYWAVGEACTRKLNSNPYFSKFIRHNTTHTGTQEYAARGDDYWNGDTVFIPGQGSVKLTEKENDPTYKRHNNRNWDVDCILNSDGTEGFKITTDNGLTYTMGKQRIVRAIKDFNLIPLQRLSQCTGGAGDPCPMESFGPVDSPEEVQYPLYHIFMQATEVRDRFGNWVKYDYHSDGRLRKITSNDSRTIDIYYTGQRITRVSANGKNWYYSYDDARVKTLATVTRPDNKVWSFSHDKYSNDSLWIYANISNHSQAPHHGIQCIEGGNPRELIEIIHPEGMKGKFVLDEECHGQSDVPKIRRPNPLRRNYDTYFIPNSSNLYSIKNKTLTFTSGETYVWNYEYSDNAGHFRGDSIIAANRLNVNFSGIDSAHLKSTTIVQPDNTKTIQYFDRRFGKGQGNLLFSENYDSNGILLKRSNYQYIEGTYHGDPMMYSNIYSSYDSFVPEDIQKGQSSSQKQLISKKVDFFASTNDTYTTNYSDYDNYDLVGKIEEYNSFSSNRRFTKKYYYNDPVHNLIGLPYRTLISPNDSSYTEVSKTDYYSSTSSYKSLPNYEYEFGRWYKRNESYHLSGVQAGLPKLVRYNGESYNANSRWVEFSNYKRGKAQTIRTPQSTSTSSQYASLVVNNDGLTIKATDFEGNCTNFWYDSIDRLTTIDPCDPRWLTTSISYSTTTSNDGLNHVYAGMQKQTINKGNYQKVTYFDSLFRPRLTKEWDKSFAPTARYVRTDYDAFSRPIFQSLPASNSTTSYGRITSYDGLGRISEVDDNTTTGVVSHTYLAGNKVRVNNNRGYDTTTTYLAYGSPTTRNAVHISAPHNTVTSLNYNIFGNVTAISQGGVTEYRIYDTYQNLCKTVRPDVGNTAMVYNALDEILWKAKGSSVSSGSSSCDSSVSATDKVTYTYDNLGNMRTESYGDVSNDKTFVYDKNSKIKSLTSGGVSTIYEYNSAQLLEKETINVDSRTFSLDYIYNSSGDLSNLIYPSGVNVAYAPNALGQPYSVGGYATKAYYHPNGAVKTHKYGNGFGYESVQYSSGMLKTAVDKKTVLVGIDPILLVMDSETSKVTSGTLDVVEEPSKIEIYKKPPALTSEVFAVNHAFYYDANNNLTYWDDRVLAINDPYDFRATYDGLDRLNLITDSYSGTGDVNYDSMGNITYYKIGDKTLNYSYNSKKQLISTSGHKVYSFQYDSKGNVISNGTDTFSYNSAGQMYSSSKGNYVYDGKGKRVKRTVNATGKTTYSMYASNGQLVYSQTDGVHTDYYYLGKKLVARKKGSVVTYVHTDFLGSPAAESNTTGTVTSKMHYKPFGESIETPKDDAGYTGHKFDTELGLNYMQARYYDPVIGRFYSDDPVGYTAANPVMSFNRYLYVNNNPYKYTDPNGEFLNFAVKFVADVAMGAAINYLTTGSANLGSAIKDSAKGVLNPAKSLHKAKKLASLFNKSGKLNKTPRGKGSVPPNKRDPKRVMSKNEKKEMLDERGGKCEGCGKDLDIDNAKGHHIKRHADGGPTTKENTAMLCDPCHKDIHSKD